MPSENLNELHAFVVVASAGSFTQAANGWVCRHRGGA